MKNYTMFNYDFLFGDHFAKVSKQAKLYYIALNFFANNGFVANPMSVLDSLGYDIGVFNELKANGELLQLEGRSEVFITSYFIHNKGIDWEDKLFVKKNGVVKFAPEGLPKAEPKDPLDKIEEPKEETEENNSDDWNNNLEETIRIAKTPWLDENED